MTFANGGQRDEGNPNRQVGPARHPLAGGFVGTYQGSVGKTGYFSAEATGGSASDSHGIPFVGDREHMGDKPWAMIPGKGFTPPGQLPQSWSAHVYDPERHGGLPGAPK
jgi:hypothetical protein